MKICIHIVCSYLFILTALPTVKVIKMHLAQNCQSSCHKKDTDIPSDCQKNKCILNFNFNTNQFIVSQIQTITLHSDFEIHKNKDLYYTKDFTEKYKNTIWQPPETRMQS